MPNMFRDFLKQIRRIPRGKVATYGDVAYAAGYPGAARQVAWALHACDASLQWHRVVGAGGKVLCTGELGFEQRVRLQNEGVTFSGLRVRIDEHRYHFFAKSAKPQAKGSRARSRNSEKAARIAKR